MVQFPGLPLTCPRVEVVFGTHVIAWMVRIREGSEFQFDSGTCGRVALFRETSRRHQVEDIDLNPAIISLLALPEQKASRRTWGFDERHENPSDASLSLIRFFAAGECTSRPMTIEVVAEKPDQPCTSGS
jgi:hypothetical protein